MASSPEEQYVTTATEDYETTCWGCGLRLLLQARASVFKCGWCGAITNQNKRKCDDNCFRWRRLRDRCFVSVVILFMLFVIFGGVWAVYPGVFSVSLLCGVSHSIITTILAVATISFYSFASFGCAGTPPAILWGSYPTIGKGDLEDYTFCNYCSKPKSPGTHHCRSCGKCIMDMDHHCPFIGNCVGAGNQYHFIAFLISAVISTIYVSIMSVYTGIHIWPPLTYSFGRFNQVTSSLAWRVMSEIFLSFLRSALFLSARGIVLVYLFISSVSVMIGLSVLLWQQLFYIYEGRTYLSHLSNGEGKKDCQNLVRFFGFPYSVSRFLPNFRVTQKRHIK